MMGWTKGLGADLSDKVEDMLQPSAVFEFEAPVFDEGWTTPAPYRGDNMSAYDASISAPKPYPIHHLSPVGPPSGVPIKFSPADLRQLYILSYFHAVFPSKTDQESPESLIAQAWDVNLPLCAQPPYEITCDSALDLVILTGAGSEDVVYSEIHRVLNGSIVGLVSYEPGTLEKEDTTDLSIPYVQGTAPPLPTASTCHGLALIRSLSSPPQSPTLLHILTPVPPSILAKTPPRVLIKGDMELPVWGMLDFRSETHIAGVSNAEVPYLRWGTSEAVGANRRRVRRNLMRKAQM